MTDLATALIFFVYGLAFFSMGFATALEAGRAPHAYFQKALRALAIFGLLHGLHEWVEMFGKLGLVPAEVISPLSFMRLRVALLAVSFLPLPFIGVTIMDSRGRYPRAQFLPPLLLLCSWGIASLALAGRYSAEQAWAVAGMLARYFIAMPSALLAALGFRLQCIKFKQEGRDYRGKYCTWVAISFAVYGAVGQLFARKTPLPPSTYINEELFQSLTGFPVQLLRALAAGAIAYFILRLLREFEFEMKDEIERLQQERLEAAQRREALRGDLIRRIVSAQESERRRIARELHDETGQTLTALGMGLRGLSASLRGDPDKEAEKLRHLEQLVEHSLVEIQRIISDLRPSHLDDLGLPAALRWYLGEISMRAPPLDVEFEVRGQAQEIAHDVSTALFRVAQEALTNVIKHANAQHVWVRLEFDAEEVGLYIRDDGCGFDAQSIQFAGRDSLGLIGMQERAILFGGHFKLRSRPGEGTFIEVVVPRTGRGRVEDVDSADSC